MYFYNLFSPCLIYLYYNKSAKVLWFAVGLVVVVMDCGLLWVAGGGGGGGGECGGLVDLAVVVACRGRGRQRERKKNRNAIYFC